MANISSQAATPNTLRWRKMYVPLITVLGSALLFFLYYVFYVSWQRNYADERAFRLLSAVCDQLVKRLDGLTNTLTAAYFSPDPKQYLESVLKDRVSDVRLNPAFKKSNAAARQEIAGSARQRKGALRRQLMDYSGGLSFQMEFRDHGEAPPGSAFCGAQAPPSICANVILDAETRERFHHCTEDYFDDVLVVTSTGEVIFQTSLSGVRITNLNSILHSQRQEGDPAPPVQKDMAAGTAFGEASRYSNVVDVTVAGAPYKLYLQPVPTVIRNSKGQDVKPVVCGLWRKDRFQSEVVSIPYSILIWTTLMLLAAFALGWPLLKFAYLNASERLRRRQVFYLLFSSLVGTGLLALIVLNLSYTLRGRAESEEQLRALASQIERNLKGELVRALAFMTSLDHDETFMHDALRRSKTDWMRPRFLKIWETHFRETLRNRDTAFYPYFDLCFWADDRGKQQLKVSVRDIVTPPTPVDREGFFRAILHPNDLPVISSLIGDSKDPRPAAVGPDGENVTDTPIPGWAPSEGARFRFDSRYSPNTGVFHVVLARPYTAPPTWTDLPENAKHLTAQVLVVRFLSLLDPVVPAGFGFAIVDQAGIAQFHSISARNQIEDFFKECRQNEILKALVSQGSEDILELSYMGERQQLLVRPMPFLGSASYSLVVFRACNDFSTVNVACLLVFSLLACIFGVPFVIALALYVRRGDYPLAGLWPMPTDTRNYVDVLVANACLTAAFVLRFSSVRMNQMLIAVLAIAGVAIWFAWPKPERAPVAKVVVLAAIVLVAQWSVALLAAGIYLAASAPLVSGVLQRRAGRFRLTPLYVAVVFSLLTVTVVLPCFGLFKVSYDTVNRLALQRAQLERRDQLLQRAEQIRSNYRDLQADEFINPRIAENLDRYDNAVFDPDPKPLPTAETEPDASWLEPLIARATGLFPSNGLGAGLREVALATQGRFKPVWSTAENGDDRLLWLKGLPKDVFAEEKLLGVYALWQLPVLAAAVMALLAVLLAVWIYYLVKKVFVTELEDLPPLPVWRPYEWKEAAEGNLLIIGHPKSGKTGRVTVLPHAQVFDVAAIVTTGSWDLPPMTEPTAVVDHFEFDIDNPDICLAKLHLLERLLYVENRRVILLSAIDPMFYLVSSSPEIVTPSGSNHEPPTQLLDRWSGVLSRFQKAAIEDVTDQDLTRVLKENQPEPWRRQLVRMVLRECNHTTQLRQIGLAILQTHFERGPITPSEFMQELLDRTDSYYRVLWATCSKTERLVLYQLAKDGWANPNNGRAIQELQRRRMIRKDCGLRIMNQTFRRFVRAAQCPQEVAWWEQQEQHSAWSGVKLALATGVLMFGAWLLYTQRDVFQMGVGYVSVLGTASGAIINLARNLTGRSAGGSA
jgi:hypothetical protein